MGRFILGLLALVVVTASIPAAPANAASWNAFSYADFHGIDIVQTIQADNSVVYNLSFVPSATIVIDSIEYQINWLQGFYIRTADVAGRFAATDAGVTNWKWVQKPPAESTYNLAGWHGTGANRLYAGQPAKALTFASLDTQGVPVSFGYHVGYMFDGYEKTGFFYGNVLPEPSSLQAGCLLLTGLGGFAAIRRRLRV